MTDVAGKSVLIKCIVGILTPDAGSIKIDGQEIVGMGGSDRDLINQKLGMLFQGAALFDSLPLWENVAFGRPDASEAEIIDAARAAQAHDFIEKLEILFFDEPTTGSDPIMGDVIDSLIVECVKELGATALTITHDMESARRVGDRIAMIYEGKIVWVGGVDAIEHSGNDVVDQFINGRIEGPMSNNQVPGPTLGVEIGTP